MKHLLVQKAGLAALGTFAAFLLSLGSTNAAFAAETPSANGTTSAYGSDTYIPGAAYHKKIPGSSSVIQGSKPRSYIKPKKMTYQQHLDALNGHRYTKESSSPTFSHKSNPSLLKVHPNKSVQAPSSRIHVQKSIGHPGAGITRDGEKLSPGELSFLTRLGKTVSSGNPAVGARLNQIAAGQRQGQALSESDAEFLEDMAKRVQDGQAAFKLKSIASKGRASANGLS